MNCCEYHDLPAGCRQGRDCPRALQPALHTKDGGHTVAGPLSFPIEREEDDVPVITPEEAESIPAIAKGLVLLALFGLAAIYAVNLIAQKGAL